MFNNINVTDKQREELRGTCPGRRREQEAKQS